MVFLDALSWHWRPLNRAKRKDRDSFPFYRELLPSPLSLDTCSVTCSKLGPKSCRSHLKETREKVSWSRKRKLTPSVVLVYCWWVCYCETQPPASIGWVALSSMFVVRPASVTPPLISTIWCFRPYKPYIFCEDMILATCQCHILSCIPSIWVSHSCTVWSV